MRWCSQGPLSELEESFGTRRKVLGTAGLVGGSVGRSGASVRLGLTGVLGSGRSALYATCQRVCDLVAIRGKADIARVSRK
jgi:putative protein kinase ArgK-like GTPase of G3E family